MTKDLKTLREEIDRIDRGLVELYERRMQAASEVAAYKRAQGLPVLDKGREEEKLRSVETLVTSEADRPGVRELFSLLMAMSRMRQYEERAIGPMELPLREVPELLTQGKRVVYQGTEGAFAHLACLGFFGEDVDCHPVPTWRKAMEEVKDGSSDLAVLPFENSTAGIVSENYDLLVEYQATVVGEYLLPVEHCLLGVPGAALPEITRVYSHPQALLQCSHSLDALPGVARVETTNTAVAARKVSEEKDPSQAAIASEVTAGLYGLTVLRKGFQDAAGNVTRFIVVTKEKIFVEGATKLLLSFELPDESGSLFQTLRHFSIQELNMSHIVSRPLPERNWEYRFFIALEGNLRERRVADLLTALSQETRNLIILGNYR